jgi:hypothetical protein
MIVEIHFQEGFLNDELRLLVNSTLVETFNLNTRLQTGLASIKKLDVNPGSTIQVVMPGHEIKGQFIVDQAHRYVKVNIKEGKVVISATDQMPGYL